MLIKSVSLENFKAVRRSGVVRLKPLTVLIGHNGSGKSSLLEALDTYRQIVFNGAAAAMENWQGFEHIRHKSARARLTAAAQAEPSRQQGAMVFALKLVGAQGPVELDMALNIRDAGNIMYLQRETCAFAGESLTRRAVGQRGRQSLGVVCSAGLQPDVNRALQSVDGGQSLLPFLSGLRPVTTALRDMRLLRLDPVQIGQLQPVRRSDNQVMMAENGANVAEYLIDLRERSQAAFDDVVRSMQFILPYASDVEPKILDTAVMRRGYIQILEGSYEIPGWLMSSGSLRVLPLVALLLDPAPPAIILIEELENGLDPRTVSLLVDLMRDATSNRRTQIIATSHSPYLLDLLSLEDILVCERDATGSKFWWPDGQAALRNWRDRFSPGKLYTMSVLEKPKRQINTGTTPPIPAEAPEGGWGTGE